MAVPDKLRYTKAEKTAEILHLCLAAAYIIVLFVLMALSVVGIDNSIFLVVFVILVASFSIGSVYPQHTNLVKNPATVTETILRRIRHCIIFVKIGVSVLFFAITITSALLKL